MLFRSFSSRSLSLFNSVSAAMQFVRFKLATRQTSRQGQQASKAKQAVIFPYYLNGAIRLIMRVLYKKPQNGIINGTVHLLLSGANYIFVYFPSGFFSVCVSAVLFYLFMFFTYFFWGESLLLGNLTPWPWGKCALLLLYFLNFLSCVFCVAFGYSPLLLNCCWQQTKRAVFALLGRVDA